MNPKTIARIVFAASVLAFAFLLMCFVVVLMMFDLDAADRVWRGIYPAAAWGVALLICIKYLK